MSYSFTVKAKNRSEVGTMVRAELDKVVEGQPVHNNDADVAYDTAITLSETLVDLGEGESYSITVSGSLSWREEGQFTGANLSVSASVVKD